MKTFLNGDIRALAACSLVGSLVACSSSRSMDGKGSAGKSPNTIAKSSASTDGDSDEAADADMPQEIAGGFLTCAYVSTEESGFAESDENMPVGCAVMKDGEKITDPNLSYKIGLYFPNKKPDEMVTKDASASSKWHGFGNLPRANKTKHFLGMTVTDRNNNRPEETVYFPVKDLQLDNPEIPFNLVGGYESANPYDYSKIISEQLKRVLGNAVTYDNKTSPILPLGACSHGVKRDQYDLTQYSDPIMQVSAFAGKLGESANIDALKQKQSLKEGSMRLKAVDCFVLAKEAGPSSWSKVIGTPRPVLEGEGCLFLQSPMGIVIYDKPQIEKYNIKKEFLETYVKARMCPDAK